MAQTLEFKWTISRGRETYGYNIVTLYVDGVRVAKCSGGGYDMEGTCFADFLQKEYQDVLMENYELAEHTWDEVTGKRDIFPKSKDALYGMTLYTKDGKPSEIVLDGAAGMSSIKRIAGEIGLRLTASDLSRKNRNLYILEVVEYGKAWNYFAEMNTNK